MKKLKKLKKSYHIFTDGKDEYFEKLEDALKLWRAWRKYGADNIRLYELLYDKDEFYDENCIKSIGAWPY